jgi:hypothetical protein
MKPSRCTIAIWNWDRSEVLNYCNFELSLVEQYQPIKIGEGTWIIHKKAIPSYEVKCGGEVKGHELTHWAETVTLESGCRLKSESHVLYGPLKYRDARLDMIQTKPPQFLFSVAYTPSDIKKSERKNEYETHKREKATKMDEVNVERLTESLQLDARFSTAVNDKLYRSVSGIQLRMMRLEAFQYNAQNKITLISLLQAVGKFLSFYSGFVFMISMIRGGNSFLGMRAILIVGTYGRVEAYSIVNDEVNPEGIYETLIGDPLGPALTIILLGMAVFILCAMKFKSMFRTMMVTDFRGRVYATAIKNQASNYEYNRNCYLYISFLYRTGTLLKAYLNEVTLKIPTTFLDNHTKDCTNVVVRGALKHWHIDYENGKPCFVVPFPVYVRVELENGRSRETEGSVKVPLDMIKWRNRIAPTGLDSYGMRGTAMIQFVRESK